MVSIERAALVCPSLIFLLTACGGMEADLVSGDSDNLYGGSTISATSKYKKPTLVILDNLGSCSAVKVGTRTFLTAAHCVTDLGGALRAEYVAGRYIFVADATNIGPPQDGQGPFGVWRKVFIERTHVRSGYVTACRTNCSPIGLLRANAADLALVVTEEALPGTTAAIRADVVENNQHVVMVGYGKLAPPPLDIGPRDFWNVRYAVDTAERNLWFLTRYDSRASTVATSYNILTQGALGGVSSSRGPKIIAASLQPGDSGGPLFREDGSLAGIHTLGISASGANAVARMMTGPGLTVSRAGRSSSFAFNEEPPSGLTDRERDAWNYFGGQPRRSPTNVHRRITNADKAWIDSIKR